MSKDQSTLYVSTSKTEGRPIYPLPCDDRGAVRRECRWSGALPLTAALPPASNSLALPRASVIRQGLQWML